METDSERLAYAVALLDHVRQIAANGRGEPEGRLRKIAQEIDNNADSLAGVARAELPAAVDQEKPELIEVNMAIFNELRRLRLWLKRNTPGPAPSATGECSK